MERLSGLDASFLYLETPQQLMHVCGLIVTDVSTVPGGYSFPKLREELDKRVRDIPMFNRKLKGVPLGLDHPLWVYDRDFDIDRHLHRVAVPAPGGPEDVAGVISHLAGIGLDRSRPLWEMWVIEGLASGQLATFLKMHHASVDGVSGADMLSHLCSLDPDAVVPDSQPVGGLAKVPGNRELFARGLLANLTKPAQAMRLIGPTTDLITKTISRARRGTAMAAPLTAPRTSFNGTITGHRTIGYTDLPLSKVKAIKSAVEGATVNDVVLTISGGALRRYLDERGELPTTSLVATVPVSVHSDSHRINGSNRVSSIFCRLRTDVADPLERLKLLAVSNRNSKEHGKAIPADTLQEWAELAAPRTFGLAVRMVADLGLAERGPVIHNLVISNVPGPPMPLYFMGGRIEGLYALGPIFHGAGLNITVLSNDGKLHVGVIACRESMPRIGELIDAFSAELDALYAAAVGQSA